MSPKVARSLASVGLLAQLVLGAALFIGFSILTSSFDGPRYSNDPAAVTALLEDARHIIGWGQLIGFVGFAVLLVVVLNGVEQMRWFLWGGLVSSVVHFFLFPIGTVLGGIGLLLFMRALRRSDNPPSPPIQARQIEAGAKPFH